MKNPISLLRRIALTEGVSFLVLLGIAMPLKYFADMPGAVKVVGWAHGVLFVMLCAQLVWVMLAAKWPMGRGVLVFVSALLPFGPFVLDSRMKQYEADYLSRSAAASSPAPSPASAASDATTSRAPRCRW